MASPKKPSSKEAGSPAPGSTSEKAPLRPIAETLGVGFDGFDYAPLAPDVSRFALAGKARAILARSRWTNERPARRSGILCKLVDMLVALLRKMCPDAREVRPFKPGEVAGELAVDGNNLEAMVAAAAGAEELPRTIWSDGTNELLVELAGVKVVTLDGLVQVTIPVACEEAGPVGILVNFATGSRDNPAGLVFATETLPEGPPEIVAIWGEALVALAWTAVLRTLATLADAAGSDKDGAGLIPAGVTADRDGVKLLVMARHEMDRVVK